MTNHTDIDHLDYWRAVESKDAAFEGRFFYGVMTTKIYCRPGCTSRTPLRRNVRFYPSPVEAEADGLRPCKLCRPLEAPVDATREKIRQVRNYIREHLDDHDALKLESLSRTFGLSPFHFQRTFRKVMGLTPKQYAEGLRIETLKEDLRTSETITDAIYSAGFASSSRVYERAGTRLGMTPKQYRTGGKSVEISYVTSDTPLGLVLIGATHQGLCFIEFGESREQLLEALKAEFPAASLMPMQAPYPAAFGDWMRGLSSFIDGQRATGLVPVSLHGTAFQLKVWRYLQTIPAGTVESYSEVARGIGHPTAVRAVASACAANRVAVVVPCHRVIRGDGGLGGYRWGLPRKRALIDAERRANTGLLKSR